MPITYEYEEKKKPQKSRARTARPQHYQPDLFFTDFDKILKSGAIRKAVNSYLKTTKQTSFIDSDDSLTKADIKEIAVNLLKDQDYRVNYYDLDGWIKQLGMSEYVDSALQELREGKDVIEEGATGYNPLDSIKLKAFKNDSRVKKEFVTEDHKKAISQYCKGNNVSLSVRQTGNLSLDRLNKGAKAKPHSILEKSIKAKTLEGSYKKEASALNSNKSNPPKIEGVSINDLKGFVGHWSGTKLLGLRVDESDLLSSQSEKRKENPSDDLIQLQDFISGKDTKEPYIPLNKIESFKKTFKTRWQHFLYTGDYDLHEIFKLNKFLSEGSKEKAKVLSGINDQIALSQQENESFKGAEKQPIRSGTIGVDRKTVEKRPGQYLAADLLHIQDNSQYAMIQHGDQAGYHTNQQNETLRGDDPFQKAALVGAVAQESPDPLAWCVKGEWYVTKNNAEHKQFRELINVPPFSGWNDEIQAMMKQSKGTDTRELSKRKGKVAFHTKYTGK